MIAAVLGGGLWIYGHVQQILERQHGATLETLWKRQRYGGRKGRAAKLRLKRLPRWAKKHPIRHIVLGGTHIPGTFYVPGFGGWKKSKHGS